MQDCTKKSEKDHLTERLWLAELCTANFYTEPKLLRPDAYAVIAPFMFTFAIIQGRIGDKDSYQDRWCYENFEDAKRALDDWDGTGEPDGWHRHPLTGRRRTPENEEYINP